MQSLLIIFTLLITSGLNPIKKNLILLTILSCCPSLNAQIAKDTTEHIRRGLTETEFKKAIDGYIKMVQSETYKNRMIATDKMIGKINGLPLPKSIMHEKEWSIWARENLPKTKFKNIQEAIELRKLSFDLLKKTSRREFRTL